MAEVIDRIIPGLHRATKILAEFMFYIREEQIDKKKNGLDTNWDDFIQSWDSGNNSHGIDETLKIKSLDFNQLVYLLTHNKDSIEKGTKWDKDIVELIVNYAHEIKTLRNMSHHSNFWTDYATAPDFVARTLDTKRRFIQLLLPYVNHNKGVEDEIFLPEFHYSINQPQDSMVSVNTVPTVKAKTTENILVRNAPFDFSKARFDVNRNTFAKIFKDFNFLKKNESVLIVKTSGDVFQYNIEGEGYTGDWTKDVEVTKLLIIHFFEGKFNRNAYMYVADYKERIRESNYTPKRYRYYFTNIQYCGMINADFDRDFKSCQVIRYEDLM